MTIDTITLEHEAPQAQQLTIEDVRLEIATKTDAQLTYFDSQFKSLRDYSEQLAESTKKSLLPMLTARSVCQHIKIADKPIVKLKQEAHPMLAPILGYLGTAKPEHRNIWLYGPKGSGKSTLIEQIAEAQGTEANITSCVGGMSAGSISVMYDPMNPMNPILSSLMKRFKDGGVAGLDEAGAAPADGTVAWNNALSLGYYELRDGTRIQRHANFVMVAADNTVGLGADSQYVARERQDRAYLDRFLPIFVGYSSLVDEIKCPDKKLREYFQEVRQALAHKNSPETISPRLMEQAYTALRAPGWTPEMVWQSLTALFPRGLPQQVGFGLIDFMKACS